MALASISDIVNAVKLKAPFAKNSLTTVAGGYFSLFGVAGQPGAATDPATLNGQNPDDSSAGSLKLFTNPTNPANTYLGNLAASASQPGMLYIYDRLWENLISSTSTSLQSITSGNFPRTSGWSDVEIWFSIYTAMGAGANAPTIVYTNEAGTGSKTGTVQGYAASAIAERQFPISLAAGDRGVKSVQSITNTVSMTSGTCGLVARRKLAAIPIAAANIPIMLDAIQNGLAEVPDDACLELMVMSQTTAFASTGLLQLLQG